MYVNIPTNNYLSILHIIINYHNYATDTYEKYIFNNQSKSSEKH